ncbi:PREDICTED: lipase member N-like [Sturnus vulgaris]|uniref:lipase member N-like n=1 Tax=Sturnus vulgaris TaxID=9172 RepID=UPI00071A2CEC|nr:PREDICTED: lipase member N-like [Sturnus vulgaris]
MYTLTKLSQFHMQVVSSSFSGPIVPQVLRTGEMWLLLVALCLAQGLEDAIPDSEVFYNPETFMNISQKILFHGYSSEEYDVMTEDGYFLSLNRIPHGKEDAGLSGPRTPVLIVHGFCLDGGDWVDNFPDSSLAFILADAGYDVWIGNNRGTSWSRRHRSLSISSEEFWDFSFHEMAMYDLPAMVDFILNVNGQEKLFYIGHSQGSSLGFIAFSSMPHLAEKIKLFFALAPAYTFRHVRGPVLKLVFLPDLLLKELFGTRELVLVPRKEKELLVERCSKRLAAEVCVNGIFLVGGFDRNNLNSSRLDVYLSHFPDYTSVKTLLHWGQTAKSAHFRQFDYGLKNMEKYNQLTPPYYPIEAMRVPVALWSGGQDWAIPPVEIQRLLSHLTNVVHHEHFPDWNHFDHFWGLNAPQRMYRQMVALMKQNP